MSRSSPLSDGYLAPSPTDLDEMRQIHGRASDEEDSRDISALPEGGYGWVCVAASFLLNAHTWGINSAYGVILSFYLTEQTFPGTTALDYAFVGGLSIGCAMLVSPLATVLVHQCGIRVTVILGASLVTTSFITTSFVQSTWQLFLSQGVCFGLGLGFSFIGSVGVVSHWFGRRRSLVNGITAAGGGIGGLIYSLATGSMLPRLGFPWTMRIFGIICFAVNLCCGSLLRLPSNAASPPASGAMRLSAFRNIKYTILLTWGALSALGYVVLLFSLSSYAVAVGRSQHQASIVIALLNLGQAFGRPAVGILSDKLGRVNVALAATMLCGILCFVFWIFAKSMAAICFFAIAAGLVSGTLWATAAPLTAEIVGLGDMSSALGFFWLTLGPPCAVAEAIAVLLRDDVTDRYPYMRVQMLVGAVYTSAAMCLALLKGVQFTSKRK